MDTVYVANDFYSDIVRTIAETREPFVRIANKESKHGPDAPYVLTEHGIIFGLPAVIDYLLHRISEPPLIHNDIRRRGLQLTVFWALVEREWPKLLEPGAGFVGKWLWDLSTQLRSSDFYAGDQFGLCDVALEALLQHLQRSHYAMPHEAQHYLWRCQQAVAAIKKRNEESVDSNDD